MSLSPFPEWTQLLAHQVAFGAKDVVSVHVTLRKDGPVVRNTGS